MSTQGRGVVGMTPTPDGKSYWLVQDDGRVFTFGDARFYGSTGDIHLAAPIVGMPATPDGDGYWLVAKDGGVFTLRRCTVLRVDRLSQIVCRRFNTVAATDLPRAGRGTGTDHCAVDSSPKLRACNQITLVMGPQNSTVASIPWCKSRRA